MKAEKGSSKIGRPFKHSGFALVNRESALREHPAIRKYLESIRGQIAKDLGGEGNLSGTQKALLDRAISLLSRILLVEWSCRDDVILPARIHSHYVGLNNGFRLALGLLGVKAQPSAGVPDLGAYLAEKAKETSGGPGDGAKDIEAGKSSHDAVMQEFGDIGATDEGAKDGKDGDPV